MLDRALPQVAVPHRRRRDDPFLVDPASAYRLAAAALWGVVGSTGGRTRRGRM